jgi:hypothetical protein
MTTTPPSGAQLGTVEDPGGRIYSVNAPERSLDTLNDADWFTFDITRATIHRHDGRRRSATGNRHPTIRIGQRHAPPRFRESIGSK